MSQVMVDGGPQVYVRVLRHGPATRALSAAMIARLSLSMVPLGILILIQGERQSYYLAGVVTGLYALGSTLGTPAWGRLMDRIGQVRVLAPASLMSAGFLVLLSIASSSTLASPALMALAFGAGATYPPIGPALRASWRALFTDPARRKAAFAIDATSVELIFVGGPLLLSVLLVVTSPVVPLIVAAILMTVGVLSYCLTGAARSGTRPASDAGGHSWRSRPSSGWTGVTRVALVMLVFSCSFGLLDTSLAATAGEMLGGPQRIGLLFAAIAGGSTVGGLIAGAVSWEGDERTRVAVLLGLFTGGVGALSVLLTWGHPALPVLLIILFCTGLTIAPTLILQQGTLDGLVRYRMNQAQALMSAANTSGVAVGTALAGLLIDAVGLNWAVAAAAVAGAVGCRVVLLDGLPQGRLRRIFRDAELAEREVAGHQSLGSRPGRCEAGMSSARIRG